MLRTLFLAISNLQSKERLGYSTEETMKQIESWLDEKQESAYFGEMKALIQEVTNPISKTTEEKKLEEDPYAAYYDRKEYEELLKLMQIAFLVEKKGDPEEHARKLAVMFRGDIPGALTYLDDYFKKYKDYPGGNLLQYVADACDFQLPPANERLTTWVRLARMPGSLFNPKFTRILSRARELENHSIDESKVLPIISRQLFVEEKDSSPEKKLSIQQEKFLMDVRKKHDEACAVLKEDFSLTKQKNYTNAIMEKQSALKKLLADKNVSAQEKTSLLQSAKDRYRELNQLIKQLQSSPSQQNDAHCIVAKKECQLLYEVLQNHAMLSLSKKISACKKIIKQHDQQKTHRGGLFDLSGQEESGKTISTQMYAEAGRQLRLFQAQLATLELSAKSFDEYTFSDLEKYDSIFLNAYPEFDLKRYFNEHGIGEAGYQKFMALTPVMKRAGEALPPLFIKGNEVSRKEEKGQFVTCEGYYARTLDVRNEADAKLAAVLGKLSECCQSLSGENAEVNIVHGLTSPNGQFLVVFKGNPEHPQPTDEVIAQSWVYKAAMKENPEKFSVVFDSPEGKPKGLMGQLDKQTSDIVLAMYRRAAMTLTEKANIVETRSGFSASSMHMGFPATALGPAPRGEVENIQALDFPPHYTELKKLNLTWNAHTRIDSALIASQHRMSHALYPYPIGQSIESIPPDDLKRYDQALITEFQLGRPLHELEQFIFTVRFALENKYEDVLEHLIQLAEKYPNVQKYIQTNREYFQSLHALIDSAGDELFPITETEVAPLPVENSELMPPPLISRPALFRGVTAMPEVEEEQQDPIIENQEDLFSTTTEFQSVQPLYRATSMIIPEEPEPESLDQDEGKEDLFSSSRDMSLVSPFYQPASMIIPEEGKESSPDFHSTDSFLSGFPPSSLTREGDESPKASSYTDSFFDTGFSLFESSDQKGSSSSANFLDPILVMLSQGKEIDWQLSIPVQSADSARIVTLFDWIKTHEEIFKERLNLLQENQIEQVKTTIECSQLPKDQTNKLMELVQKSAPTPQM